MKTLKIKISHYLSQKLASLYMTYVFDGVAVTTVFTQKDYEIYVKQTEGAIFRGYVKELNKCSLIGMINRYYTIKEVIENTSNIK